MRRLWLNNDFGPVETISESIMIYHVVLSGDTCNMGRSPDLKSLTPAKKKDFIQQIISKYCLLSLFDSSLSKFKRLLDVNGDKSQTLDGFLVSIEGRYCGNREPRGRLFTGSRTDRKL